jgi:hypothetical protein
MVLLNLKTVSFFKKIVLVFFVFAVYSCSQEVDINADWKDITIVYGVFYQSDSGTW